MTTNNIQFRKKACWFYDIAKRSKRKTSCLFCKYDKEFSSTPDIKILSVEDNGIIMPYNTPQEFALDELRKNYPDNFCFNPKQYQNFKKIKVTREDWLRLLKKCGVIKGDNNDNF